MRRKLNSVFIVTASSLLLTGCCATRYATQWEYKVVRNERGAANLGAAELDPKLAELGSEGWELVSWNAASWVFKRPKR